jgi:hypothetical protein
MNDEDDVLVEYIEDAVLRAPRISSVYWPAKLAAAIRKDPPLLFATLVEAEIATYVARVEEDGVYRKSYRPVDTKTKAEIVDEVMTLLGAYIDHAHYENWCKIPDLVEKWKNAPA